MKHFIPTACGLALAFAGLAAEPAQAESRSYAVSWFYPAAYTQPDNCPNGRNPLVTEWYYKIMAEMGKTREETEQLINDLKGTNGPKANAARKMITERGRVDGKPVDVYLNPASVPDPHYITAVGRYAYGFNLDGRGEASPNGFEDPETHEKGVNNQLFRVQGCIENHQAAPGKRPNYPSETWENIRDTQPAWLITIAGADLKNGDVTVTIDKSLDHAMRDANGESSVDQTFRVDPDPRFHNVLRGKMKDGALLTDPGSINLQADPFISPEFNFRRAKLRLQFQADGTSKGILGGYLPWAPLHYQYAAVGFIAEDQRGIDTVAYYYALKQKADASPEPKTGQNTEISSAFWIETVPAFVIGADAKDKTALAAP